MSVVRKVLLVFSEEQEAAIRPALEAARRTELELHFRNDGEAALAEVATLQPELIVVGMELGPMEGLEFLALLLRAEPDSRRPVMVVPSPGDPFPAVVHRRDPASGRSSALELERGADPAGLILEVAAGARSSEVGLSPLQPGVPASAAPVEPSPPAEPPAPEPKAPEPPASPSPIQPAASRSDQPVWQPVAASGGAGRRAGIIVAIGLLLAAVAAVIGYLAWPRPPVAPTPGGTEAIAADQGARAARQPDAAPGAADSARAPATPVRLADQVVLPLSFGRGSPEPTVTDEAALQKIVGALRAEPGLRVEVGGHTSNEGGADFNQKLGLSRARASAKLLVARGIPSARLEPRSHGGSQPLADNDSEAGRTRNRRVTLRRLP